MHRWFPDTHSSSPPIAPLCLPNPYVNALALFFHRTFSLSAFPPAITLHFGLLVSLDYSQTAVLLSTWFKIFVVS